ncbi:hypothetical protein DPMN_065516 [Dreissena polymorpha]|uniref:Uncharacterized protein n=1 Tax=Dreissena polymorpha TaxID=45954 RepID=A0A9D3YVJ3_DREPO|nr:hypothetical protein DPMN_065516 [Dreissena polymorpha]
MDCPVMINLDEHRFGRVEINILQLIVSVPVECFDINLDTIEFLNRCQNAGLIIPNDVTIRQLKEKERSSFCRGLVLCLMIYNGVDSVIGVLMNQSKGFVNICFHLKRNLISANIDGFNREFDGNPDVDILIAEHVMREYVKFQNTTDPTVCNRQRLKELARDCMEQLRTINDPAEHQRKADLLVVVTRIRSQLCPDNNAVKVMIEEMWHCLPACVNKFYANLVYHGRDIIGAAEQGDVARVRAYGEELEKLCLRCTRISIMPMFHHRMVFVLRKLYQVTQTVEIRQLALHHCDYGFKYAQVLNTDFLIYFRKFFLMSEVLIRLGVNVDYTRMAIEHVSAPDNIRMAREKLNELYTGYVDEMVPEELLAYNFCQGRIFEGVDVRQAIEYMQEVIRIYERGLTFPVNQVHVRSYHAHLNEMSRRQPRQPMLMSY